MVCVVCPPMYGMLDGPGECAIGLGWGFRGDDGMRPPLGDGCGIWGAGGEVMLKLGWFWDEPPDMPCGWGDAGV